MSLEFFVVEFNSVTRPAMPDLRSLLHVCLMSEAAKCVATDHDYSQTPHHHGPIIQLQFGLALINLRTGHDLNLYFDTTCQ